VHIPVVDVPAFLGGVSPSAAGEFGHAPSKARPRPASNSIGLLPCFPRRAFLLWNKPYRGAVQRDRALHRDRALLVARRAGATIRWAWNIEPIDRLPRHELQNEHDADNQQYNPLPKPAVDSRGFRSLRQCFGRKRHSKDCVPRPRDSPATCRGVQAIFPRWGIAQSANQDFCFAFSPSSTFSGRMESPRYPVQRGCCVSAAGVAPLRRYAVTSPQPGALDHSDEFAAHRFFRLYLNQWLIADLWRRTLSECGCRKADRGKEAARLSLSFPLRLQLRF
jgi:hypothetical protein